MTALHANSKLDTVLLLDGSLGSLTVDYSQHGTDLTNSGGYYTEAASARTAFARPREITVIFDFNTTAGGGTLVDLSLAGVVSYRLDISSTSIRAIEGGSTRLTAAMPGTSTTTRKFLVQWSCFPEGSSTRGEMVVYNFATGAWAHATPATHATTTPNAAHTLAVGARSDGTVPHPSTIYQVRIGARYHSQTEAMEDWVSTTAAPSITASTRCEGAPIDNTTEVGTQGAFAGPAALTAGRATKRAQWRLLSPLVNQQVQSPLVLQSTYAPDEWHRVAWNATTSRLALHLLFRRPVPPVVRYAWVRIHVLQYTVGAGIVPVYLRCYSLNRLPTIFNDVNQVVAFHTEETNINTNHTIGGTGEWKTLGLLPIARDENGFSYFCISYDFNHDVANANLANTRLQIRTVVIDPFPDDTSGGPSGLDILEG